MEISLFKLLVLFSTSNEYIKINKTVYVNKISIDLWNKLICIGDVLIYDKELLMDTVETDENVYKITSLIGKEDLTEFGILDASVDVYKVIQFLYNLYHRSMPDVYSVKRKLNLRCIGEYDLTEEDLENVSRNLAQTLVEAYIMLSTKAGWVSWEFGDKYFKPFENKLVLFKDWFE